MVASNSDTAVDACRIDCSFPSCGDGVLDTGEACDDGVNNSDTEIDACRSNCLASSCGDRVCDTGETTLLCASDCFSGVPISLGNYGACRIFKGALFCWGHNYYGQLGDGTNTDKNIPTRVGIHSDWTHISSGEYHTCSFRNNGALYCWGRNDYVQLANGTTGSSIIDIPNRVGNNFDWTHISSGEEHTCSISNNGALYCWGYNNAGRLGNGTYTSKNTPTRIGSNSDWTHISLGYYHTCGIRNNGRLYCWGWNQYG